MKTTIYVLREDENGDEVEIPVDVEYRITGKHHAASMEGPEEFPELEIVAATGPDGSEVELTDSEKERVEEFAFQDQEDRAVDAQLAYYESREDR